MARMRGDKVSAMDRHLFLLLIVPFCIVVCLRALVLLLILYL